PGAAVARGRHPEDPGDPHLHAACVERVPRRLGARNGRAVRRGCAVTADERREVAPLSNAPSSFDRASAPAASRPVATPDRELFMIGHAHIDPVWLWPWQEGYQEARATFQSAIDRMDEFDDFVFTCDQMVLLSWVEEQDPELFERIRERVADGRWVNVGGWWVEPDCNIPLGESFARQ